MSVSSTRTSSKSRSNRGRKKPAPAKPRTPKFRLHKATGQGYVELDGRRIYLGRFDKPETEQAYHRLINEWLANGRRLPVKPEEVTIVELGIEFWRHAEEHYRKPDGTHTTTLEHYHQSLGPLKDLYGPTLVADFGPRALKAVRQWMIGRGWCRTHINRQIGRIRTVFKWGVANLSRAMEVIHHVG